METRISNGNVAGAWRRWEVALLLVSLLVFATLASYKIHIPGLYYDEVIFVGPATGQRPYDKWLGLPLLTFPYIGAVKSWLYTPIFAIFGVDIITIRFPAILVSCGTLGLGYLLVRRMLNPRWAAAFTAACALHPGFILLTKVDMGPIVLMLFLKALCLLFLFRWLEGSQRMLWAMFATCVVGFVDKFNFIWFIVALAFSTPAIYGPEVFRTLRKVRAKVWAAMAIGCVSVIVVALWTILPLLKMPDVRGIKDRFFHILALYGHTSNGAATADMWFKSVPPLPSWTAWGVLMMASIFLVLSLLVYRIQTNSRGKLNTSALRFSLWCWLMFGIIFLEIMLTPQAGGAHHTIMLFPFDLLACFSAAFLLANTVSLEGRRLTILAQGCVLLVWAASNLKSLYLQFKKFDSPSEFHGRWSPRVELLANFLNVKGENVQAIYCVDWGIGNQLQAICRPSIARKVRDMWPTFASWSAKDPYAVATARRVFSTQEKAFYVSFPKDDPAFLQTRLNFTQMQALAGNPIVPVTLVPGELALTYEVLENDPAATTKSSNEERKSTLRAVFARLSYEFGH